MQHYLNNFAGMVDHELSHGSYDAHAIRRKASQIIDLMELVSWGSSFVNADIIFVALSLTIQLIVMLFAFFDDWRSCFN